MNNNSPLRHFTDLPTANTPQYTDAELAGLRAAEDNPLTRGFNSAIGGMVASHTLGRALGAELDGDTERHNALLRTGLADRAAAQATGPRVSSLRDVDSVGSALELGMGFMGQAAGSMLPTVLAAAATRGRLRAPATLGTAYNIEADEAIGNQYGDPVLAQASAEDRINAARAKGIINAGLESVVPLALFGGAARAGSAAKRVGRAMLEEGATETAQEAVGFGAEKYLDPDRQLDPVRLADAALAGALGGGGVSAVVNAPAAIADTIRKRQQAAPMQEQGPAAEPPMDAASLGTPLPGPDDSGGGGGGVSDLFDTLNERFGDGVREQAQKTKDYVSDTIDRMGEAAKTAQSPSDFLRQVFGNSSEEAAVDLRPDIEDPSVLNATDPAAALQQRDAERQQRAARFAEELLNDPATPDAIKERVASFGGDFTNPEAQAFVARNLVAQRAGEKLAAAIADLTDLSKEFGTDLAAKARDTLDEGMTAAADRIVKKKNLQDINEADVAPLIRLLAQRLGPTKAAEAPRLARQLVAAANRLSPDARITEETERRLRNFSEAIDDGVLDLVTELSGSDALRNSIAKIRAIPSARSDVRQSNGQSFLESMLKQPLEPAVMGPLTDFVDAIGLQLGSMSSERKNQVLATLAPAFGSKREAQIVVEYYGNIRRDAFRREAEADTLADDRPSTDSAPGEVVATLENPDGTLSYGSEFGTLTEQDAAEMTASYRNPNPARPFFRSTDRAALRNARRAAPAGSRVASLREYVAQTGEAPQVVAARIRQDLRKRLTDAENRDTATVQEAIASMEAVPEAARSGDFNQLLSQLKSRKTENRTDLPGLRKQMEAIEKASGVSSKEVTDLSNRIRRAELADDAGVDNNDIANLPALRKQLSKLEERYSKSAEKVLEKYAVVMRPKDETFANDELVAKFRGLLDRLPNANVGTPAERAKKREAIAKIKKTAIKFNRKGGKTPITLSAESMAYASQARGSMKERFLDSLAAVLARPDIEGLVSPAPDTLLSRQTGLTWGDISPEKPEGPRTERQKKAQREKDATAAWAKQERMRADIETRPKLMAALRDVQRRFLADRLELTLAPDETLSLTDLIDRFPPAMRPAMQTDANEAGFQSALGWAKKLSRKLATAPERNYADESRMRVLEKYIDEQLGSRFPMPEGDERASRRLAEEEQAAGMYADEDSVGGAILDAEAELDMLEERLDAVQGIDGLTRKYERRVEEAETALDRLADSVRTPEQRDARVPGARASEEDTGLGVGVEKRGSRSSQGEVVKNSFIGAKSDPEGAAKASAALDSGASAELVWAMHGWFRGPDGKMRKELRSPVLRARVREFAENLLGQRMGTAQANSESVSADKFFDGVPGYEKLLGTLSKYTINLEDSPKVGKAGMVGVVAGGTRTLTMSIDGAAQQVVLRKYTIDKLTPMIVNGVLDPTDMFSSTQDAIREGHLSKFESVEAFEREVLAGMEKNIHHELQHILQGVEGFENGGNLTMAIVSKYGDLSVFEKALMNNDLRAARAEIERARSAMLDDIGPDADSEAVAHDLYRNLIGEVEAHDVEDRFNLSDEEAKRILPEMMEPDREFLRGVKAAIDSAKLFDEHNRQTAKKSAMGAKKGRPGKDDTLLSRQSGSDRVVKNNRQMGESFLTKLRNGELRGAFVRGVALFLDPEEFDFKGIKSNYVMFGEEGGDKYVFVLPAGALHAMQGVGKMSFEEFDQALEGLALYSATVYSDGEVFVGTPRHDSAGARELLNRGVAEVSEQKWVSTGEPILKIVGGVGMRTNRDLFERAAGFAKFVDGTSNVFWSRETSSTPNAGRVRKKSIGESPKGAAEKLHRSTMEPERGRPGKIDQQAILDEIARIRGKDVKVAFAKFADIGASGEFSMNKDKTERLIKIAVDASNPMGTAWHESLHDFFAMLGEDRTGRSIKKDLIDAAEAPQVKKRLRELLAKHPAALKQIEESAEERVAYMYQFWAEGLLRLGPTGTGIFERVRQLFHDLFGLVSADSRAEELLTALHEGKFAEPSTVAEVLADMSGDRFSNKMEKAAPALTDALGKVFSTAPDRLRAYQNDTLTELADMFSSERGKLGFIQKRFQQQGVWENKLAGVLAGTTSVERRSALENLQAMKPPSSKLEKELASFFSEMHGYMTEAGVKTLDSKTKKWVPLREVKGYFPRMFDRHALLADRAGFISLLQKHGNMDLKQANAAFDALTHGTGQLELAENEHALGFTPYAQAVQDRRFTFINPSNASEFAKYQVKDLADITTGYVKQAVHRAEYARMFGNDGEVITKMLSESGIKNRKELEDIGKVVQGLEGSLGNGMSTATKELMSGIMTLQNVVVLPLAIFSQMIDPVVLAARSGDLKDAGAAYMTAVKRLVGKEVDGEELANMLGIISQDSVLEAMGAAYGTAHMSKRMRDINRVFFKYNGMQGWNNSMRIAATVAGERYILQNRNNKETLAELGLAPSDIKIVHSALGVKPDKNNNVTLRERLDVDNPKVQQAMFRFVDQAVLRPSASNRPVWMSDPRFLLVAHLKQFTYAMHNVVLKRASRELADGNPKPWGILMLAMPVILAAEMAKFALTGTAPSTWGFKDYLVHAVERSGLLGLGDFGVQAMGRVDSGKMPGEGLLGPTFENLMEILRWIGGDPRTDFEDVLDRTVPGSRFV